MHTPALEKAHVLALEAVQALGKEHDDHEEQEEHKGGHGHHHTQHLELCDGPFTAKTFVPDVVLHVTPGCEEMEKQEKVMRNIQHSGFILDTFIDLLL